MEGDPGSVPLESSKYNDVDGAAPCGKGARTLFPEAVLVVHRVGRS